MIDFQWWFIPVWFLVVFVTSYLWTAAKYIARNDHEKGRK